MASTMLQVPQKFDIGRVFGNTFQVIRRNAGLWLALAALFSAVPTLIFQLLVLVPLGAAGPIDPNTLADHPEIVALNSGLGAIGGIISFVLSLLLQSALIRATIEDLNGKQPSMRDCLGTAVSVLLPVLGLAILVGLGVGLGLMLLIVPGIILALRWSISVPVLVQERPGITASMGRSAFLTNGSRWPLLGLFVIIIFASFGIQAALATVQMALGLIAGAVIEAVVQGVLSMVMSTATAVSYVELRQVKEGTSVGELAEIFS